MPKCLKMSKLTFRNFSYLQLLLIMLTFCQLNLCKECTNIPTQLSSHTFRYALLSSLNKSTKSTNREPLNALQSETSAALKHSVLEGTFHPSRAALQSEESILQEFSLHDVTLAPNSLQGIAQQTNLEYLLLLDVDNLVWSFRYTAGLPTPGTPYGGWESPDTELRGHFVGHYMSATALMWASTHNRTLNEKMTAVVKALNECQQKMGTGYLSAFPSELFDRFEQIQPVWAPYYTIHKIMAGLLDQYTLARNDNALTMAVNMANYFNSRVQRVIQEYSIERHWLSLNEETGGMNDVLYRLYTITGDIKHLELAHLFDKPCFLGLLAVESDSLSGFHTNTHIPVVVGAQMRYEVTGDPLYKEIGTYFMDIVNSSHSFPTGGTSSGEFWTDPNRLGSSLSTETEESCTTYNTLKVNRHLLCWTKSMKYADYYERALTNGVLSIQRGQEPGIMIYMLPMGRGESKAVSYHGWGTQFNSFWCCYGTGIESFSKLGDSIYYQEGGSLPSLYIVQFVSSTLTWDSMGFFLNQTIESPSASIPYLHVTIILSEIQQENTSTSMAKGKNGVINLRIPFWVDAASSNGSINGEILQIPSPGEFWSITRTWESGDKITLVFLVTLRAEKIKDDRQNYTSLHSIFFGPYLLAGMSTGDWDITNVDLSSLSNWIIPVSNFENDKLYSFSQQAFSDQTPINSFEDYPVFLTHFEDSVSMELTPSAGTNNIAYCTFRIVDPVAQRITTLSCLKSLVASRSSRKEKNFNWSYFSKHSEFGDLVGNIISLELFDRPGQYLAHVGVNHNISFFGGDELQIGAGKSCTISPHNQHPVGADAVFKVSSGLSGTANSVSFEAVSQPGCFLWTQGDIKTGQAVQLKCKTGEDDSKFNYASTFMYRNGMESYHHMSFIAKGASRQFHLFPLLAYKDQNYTVYFNISS